VASGFDFSSQEVFIPSVSDYSTTTKFRDEMETLGLLASCHPLSLYGQVLQQFSCVPANHLERFVGKKIQMVGWMVTGKVVWTRQDETMEFVTFEDLAGIYETIFFPDTYRRYAPQLNRHQPFLLYGKVKEDLGVVMLHVERLEKMWLDPGEVFSNKLSSL
jgi:error-prone DNA polymerase